MNPIRTQLRRAFVCLSFSALALVLPSALAHGDSPTHALRYEATSTALTGPATLPVGRVTVTFVNKDTGPHMMLLARLNKGVAMKRLSASLKKGPEAVMALVTMAGGFGPTPPQQENTITFNLSKAGRYVAFDMMSGHALPVAVTAGSATAERPKADLLVQMMDFGFDLPPKVEAGRQRWEIVNHGAEPHELILFKLNPGVTLENVMKAMERNPEAEPPMTMVGGGMPMARDYANMVTLDLEPGTYAALCFIASPANGGAPHFALGMSQQFTVVEKLAAQ